MSDIQRDIERLDFFMGGIGGLPLSAHEALAHEAWQRLKPRLTPDRERVAMAIRDVMIYHTGDESSLREKLTDAAIAAMEGNDDRA